MKARPEDLFDVFEPWTEPETEPWEPPPARASAIQVVAEPKEVQPRFTSEGALEPAPVIHDPPSMSQPRRRVGPRIAPPAAPVNAPDPATEPAEFLRAMGIPEIGRLAKRLELVGHHFRVQDLLDLSNAALRVLFWPHPGLMDRGKEGVRATLELTVSREDPDQVSAHFWRQGLEDQPTLLASTPVDLLDLPWVRTRVLDFIEKILNET